MEDKKLLSIKIDPKGELKVSGCVKLIIDNKQDQAEKQEGSLVDYRRIGIGFFYLLLFLIFISLVISLHEWVFYIRKAEGLPSILGRIFFVLTFSLLGVSFRAFKWAEIGKVSPYKAYFIEYPLIIIITTLIIFSTLSAVSEISLSYLFYTLSAPLSIIAGLGGYSAIDKLKPYLKLW